MKDIFILSETLYSYVISHRLGKNEDNTALLWVESPGTPIATNC
jgi:hypothetical protein